MDSVNNITKQLMPVYASKNATKSESSTQTDICLTVDTFSLCEPQLPRGAIKTPALTKDMASYLATKYDVEGMDRKQYTNLLVDLRNAGFISSQEYSAAYGGTMPTTGRSVLWPCCCDEIDYASFLQDCARLCEEAISFPAQTLADEENNRALAITYSHLSKLFIQIGNAAEKTHFDNTSQVNVEEKSVAALTKEQQEVERLTEILKNDKSFSESSYRDFLTYPAARELASAMILADENIQEQIAEKLFVSVPKMKAMLGSGDRQTSAQVLMKYYGVLVHKARTEGLTDTEKLLDDHLERIHVISQETFDQRMKNIQIEIEEAFRKEHMCADSSTSYSFYLDTSNFSFSVTGGTAEENLLITKIINSPSNHLEILSALYGHKREDGQYNPWMINNLPYKDELLQTSSIASMPEEYTKKMERLFPAWNQWRQNNYLKERYGFGLDDIEYAGNGVFVGKTDEITERIANMGSDFIKYGGGSFLSDIHTKLLSRYGFGLHEVRFAKDGTPVGKTNKITKLIENAGNDFLNDIKHPGRIDAPVFESAMFVFENGQFRVLYG